MLQRSAGESERAALRCGALLCCAGAEAGETFMKLADVHLKLESKHDAASCWVEAAKAFMKVDQRSESAAGPPGL